MTDNPFDVAYVERDAEPETDVFGLSPIPSEPKPAPKKGNGIVIHRDVEQGSIAWLELRRGILTSSEMKLIVCPPPKEETRVKKNGEPYKQREWTPFAENDECRAHLYELLAQRVTGHVEPHFQSYDMERGNFDEEHARAKYSEEYDLVEEVGFVTNDKLGFPIGCSPDGLVDADGGIEVKSRIQKHQMRTLIECVAVGVIPADFLIQVQSSLFVTERKWWDFVSYSGGMMMASVRCYPDPAIHEAIGNAAVQFEAQMAEKLEIYENLLASDARLVPTERLIYL